MNDRKKWTQCPIIAEQHIAPNNANGGAKICLHCSEEVCYYDKMRERKYKTI